MERVWEGGVLTDAGVVQGVMWRREGVLLLGGSLDRQHWVSLTAHHQKTL
jgi:hypothetical protein